MSDTPPTMSQFAKHEDCLEARAKWFEEKLALANQQREELERQVAVMREALLAAEDLHKTGLLFASQELIEKVPKLRAEALAATQSTAEAYDRKVMAKAYQIAKEECTKFVVVNDESGIAWVESADINAAFEKLIDETEGGVK